MLASLRLDVLPVYEPKWHEYELKATGLDGVAEVLEGMARRIPIGEEIWTRFQTDSDRPALREAMARWGEQFNVTEAWIFESALDALLAYFQLGTESEHWVWWYQPRGFHARFEPKFPQNIWYPPRGGWAESWKDFKARMNLEFRRQLSDYKRYVEVKFGVGKEEHLLRRDAEWTARYQKGELAVAICESAELTGYDDSAQAVFVAIKTFAKLIGLKLRKRGQRIPKKISVVRNAK
jgi:hypothetical protein